MQKLFGDQLREERKKQDLTAETIARACGISRSYITLIESGKRQPGKKILPKIAIALHLNTSIVLDWYLVNIKLSLEEGI